MRLYSDRGSDSLAWLALFALALALRLWRLFQLDVWFDEAVILFQTQESFRGIWNFCRNENFPPLYPWLAKFWGLIFPGENALRVLSTLLGALIPPLAYQLGKKLLDRRLGWLTGLAATLSLSLIYYSQVTRMYSLWVLLICLSCWGFIRALRSNDWKYWALTAAANLLAFYTFLFTVFVMAAQTLLLIYYYRLQIKRYTRAFWTHLPALIVMSFWAATLLQRYEVQQSYAPPGLLRDHYFTLFAYLGTCITFGNKFIFASLINLPFLGGFLLGIPTWSKKPARFVLGGIVTLSLLAVLGLNMIGKPIFAGRYLLYVIPLYLILSLYGWHSCRQLLLNRLGVSAVFAVLIFTFGYYQYRLISVHDALRYEGAFHSAPSEDGRSISKMAALLSSRLQSDEVIIHYSSRLQRTFSYFPALYYHRRALPEYLYGHEPIPAFAGRQYLREGDWIKSLADVQPPPVGVWVETLEEPELLLDRSYGYRVMGLYADKEIWIDKENLPLELEQNGYRFRELIRQGSVSALYYVKEKSN